MAIEAGRAPVKFYVTIRLFLLLLLAIAVPFLFHLYWGTGRRIIERQHRVDVDMANLKSAIMAYQSEYGVLPLTINASNGFMDNAKLVALLTGKTNNMEIVKSNPQGIRFLKVASDSLVFGEFVDPWRHPYRIVFDLDGDGKVVIVGGTVISAPVAMWSDGPNGINEGGKGDDRLGWKNRRIK
jgi:hypothetical protein